MKIIIYLWVFSLTTGQTNMAEFPGSIEKCTQQAMDINRNREPMEIYGGLKLEGKEMAGCFFREGKKPPSREHRHGGSHSKPDRGY